MKLPLVTIAIISYNYCDYITEAVDSALGQTYGNCEVVVIDDGSTDATLDVLKKYGGRIKVIANSHKGLIATRNYAVRHLNGEYLIQLDADDYLDRTYVEKTVKCALKTGADIVYTQAHVFGRAEFVTAYMDYDYEKLKHDNYIHASSLVRKNALAERSYDSYLEDKGYEDWDLFLDICMDGAKAVLVNEPLLHYRKHQHSASRSDDLAGYRDVLARHHIWSKQNQKHPDEFGYFSSQIKILLDTIKLYDEHATSTRKVAAVKKKNAILQKRVAVLEKRDLPTIIKKLASSGNKLGKKR